MTSSEMSRNSFKCEILIKHKRFVSWYFHTYTVIVQYVWSFWADWMSRGIMERALAFKLAHFSGLNCGLIKCAEIINQYLKRRSVCGILVTSRHSPSGEWCNPLNWKETTKSKWDDLINKTVKTVPPGSAIDWMNKYLTPFVNKIWPLHRFLTEISPPSKL